MIARSSNQFNLLPSHRAMRSCILYYNVVFPESGTFMEQYTLMPNAAGTLSLAFDGNDITAELWGASQRPVLMGMEPSGYRVLVLIQLSPYGLYQITRQSQAEFADKRILLKNVDRELFDSLHKAFVTAKNITDLKSACDAFFYKRMENCAVSDSLLLAAGAIRDSHGQLQVREAARQSGYSERQLNRLFLTQIGVNVKSFARITRFNYVLEQLKKSPGFFAALSQRAGYFDQAHFDKDFKSLSGISPLEYLKTMSDFYYDTTAAYNTMSLWEE